MIRISTTTNGKWVVEQRGAIPATEAGIATLHCGSCVALEWTCGLRHPSMNVRGSGILRLSTPRICCVNSLLIAVLRATRVGRLGDGTLTATQGAGPNPPNTVRK